jgi:uncharacterized membrane protein
MAALARLLYPLPDLRRSPATLLGWWERRRPAYNLVVGATGLLTLAVVEVITALTPGLHFQVPLVAIVVYGMAANVCYSLGFFIELVLERLWGAEVAPVGPVLFRQGLLFSVGLTLLPIGIAWIGWIAAVLHYLFFA